MVIAYRKLVGVLPCAVVIALAGCGTHPVSAPQVTEPPQAPPASEATKYIATAYSIFGRTASGVPPHRGVVAADPAVLPLGSRIRVNGAGQYSGEYVVHDTGAKVRGHKIDIYGPRHAQAKRFGRQHVTVEVLHYGDGHRRRACVHHCRKPRRLQRG